MNIVTLFSLIFDNFTGVCCFKIAFTCCMSFNVTHQVKHYHTLSNHSFYTAILNETINMTEVPASGFNSRGLTKLRNYSYLYIQSPKF